MPIDISRCWLFIINPAAGAGRARHIWPKIAAAFDRAAICHRAVFTHTPDHAIELACTAQAEGYRYFVVLGGDGTLNEVVNGLCRHPQFLPHTYLTVFPCGSGNDWATYYRLPTRTAAFVAMLKNPVLLQQDLGVASYSCQGETCQRFFVNFIGSGFDSHLLEQMGHASGRRLTYLRYVLQFLHSYRARSCRLKIDGVERHETALMVMACIGRLGGGGMIFAPAADPCDGQFDLLCIGDMPFLTRLLSVASLFNGRINHHARGQSFRCRQLQFGCDVPMAFQCDGEIVGHLPVAVDHADYPLNIVVSQAVRPAAS